MPALAAVVAVIQDGKILLTQREDFEVWCLPGGGVEPGESAAQAAVREAYEETGVEVELTGLVGVYSRLGGYEDVHGILFRGKPVGGEPRTQPGETIAVDYFPGDDLPAPLLFGYRQRIIDAIGGVGGSVAWVQKVEFSIKGVNNRHELYDKAAQSGLDKQEFYQRYIKDHGGKLEVGP